MNLLAAETTRRNLLAQLACVGELETLLQSEQQALDGNDTAALERIAAAKRAAVAQLDQLGAERSRLAAGLPMEQVCARSGTTDLWKQLLAAIAGLQRRNESNGALLHTRRIQVRSALAKLGGSESQLYGRGGFDSGHASARLIASA